MILPGFPTLMAPVAQPLVSTPQPFTLTAATGSNYIGYAAGEMGAISQEPLASNGLEGWVDTPNGYVVFAGDVTGILNGLPIYINGVYHSDAAFTYNSGEGFSAYLAATPFGFSAGNTYNIAFSGAVASITAGTDGAGQDGYLDPAYGGYGSITSNASPGGGTVIGILSNGSGSALHLGAGSPSVSTIILGGTSYPLTYIGSEGSEFYVFGPASKIIFSGQTYTFQILA